MSQDSKAPESPPMAIALAFVYQMGRERERFEVDLAAKLGKQLAKAFDDGFVLGRETGYKDAQGSDTDKPVLLS